MKQAITAISAIALAATLGMSSCSKSYPGALNGQFSVSETQKVNFAQGNLVYDISAQTWSFHENQFDVLKENNEKFDKDYKGENFKGTIDLLAYGSADNPALRNAEKDAKFADWGKLSITNGGMEPNTWRTLSAQEWEYIFSKRPNAYALHNWAKVGDVEGVIVLPDNWKNPGDVKFTPYSEDSVTHIGSNVTISYKNEIRKAEGFNPYKNNTFSKEQFKKLQDAGAVFLPLNKNSYSTMEGDYWTSTDDGGNNGQSAPYFYISTNTIWPSRGSIMKNYRMGVRLAKDVK